MGGGWMVTPGLNILGFPMAFAIGADISHMAGKSLVSTMRHAKFGNVDYKLGLIMTVGTVAGVEAGAQMIMWLERTGDVEAARCATATWRCWRFEWHRTLRRIQIPPVVHFRKAGIRCSAWQWSAAPSPSS